MSNTAITPHMDLQSLRQMGSATRRRVTVNAENTTGVTLGSSTQDVYFAIPASAGTLINSGNTTLQFDAVSTVACQFANGSASSVIRSMELLIGNSTVSLLENYNVFAAIIEDLQSSERTKTMGSILNGSSATAFKTGADLTDRVRISIPILESVIGTLASNYCPCVDGMRLRISFDTASRATQAAAAAIVPNLAISNIALQMDYLDINPSVYQNMLSENGGVFSLHGSGVANFQASSLATTSQTHLIPSRFSSIKNFYSVWRGNDVINADRANSIGCRYNPCLSRYSYRVGGKAYPSVPVRCSEGTTYLAGEQFAEVVQASHAAHNVNFDVVFNKTAYLDATVPTSADLQGSHLIALDFEESNYGSVRGLISGINTISNNVFLETTHAAAPAAATLDTFAVYDLLTEINMMTGEVSVSK